MIFQALVRRQRYLLTLIAIAVSIFYSLPIFAGSSWSFLKERNSFATQTIIAQHSPSVTSQGRAVSLFQQLDLTKEQQQQIKQIHLRYQQQIINQKQSIARLQQQLSDMMVGTEPIESLKAKNQQLSALRLKMESLHFESMLAIREILTLQQRQKFRELVKNSPAVE
jgi:Spy/CpxP family protein refolding chaperone